MNFNHPLILASKSPRRQQLLKQAGVKFEVKSQSVEESYPDTLPLTEVPQYLALKKAKSLLPEIDNQVVISSDTVVLCEDNLLGKPESYNEAKQMLQLLSGKEHQVITGVCLLSKNKEVVFADTTTVTFRSLSSQEIEYYITNFKPYDKAGSYGIQEWIGMIGITRISGSYFTVMGLPIHLLYEQLLKF